MLHAQARTRAWRLHRHIELSPSRASVLNWITATRPGSRGIAGATQTVTLPHIPELYNPNFLDVLLPPKTSTTHGNYVGENSFPSKVPREPALTENLAKAYSSTGDALLDAFHRPQSSLSTESFHELFERAWKTNPNMTLRIIFYIRSIHEGKGSKQLFYRAWKWLYKHHPRTAIYSLRQLVEETCPREKMEKDGRKLPGRQHGYWKDLLNILCLALRGGFENYNHGSGKRVWDNGLSDQQIKERRQTFADQRYLVLSERLAEDPKFKALYITVARLFAEALTEDMQQLEKQSKQDPKRGREDYEGVNWKISLAGKWAPTPGRSHDQFTNMSTAIALLLHHDRKEQPWKYPSALENRDSNSEVTKEESDILRSYLRRWFLSPLREVHKVPERYMGTNEWSSIQYYRVPAVCMQNNSERFYKHDYERFSKYMLDVWKGKQFVAGGTLMPHEVFRRLVKYDDIATTPRSITSEKDPEKRKIMEEIHEAKKEFIQPQIEVAMAQWRSIVDKTRASGSMNDSIAICDVSGSMGYLGDYKYEKFSPVFASLAMSLLLASISKPPFNNGFISFSATPEFIKLDEQKSIIQNAKYMSRTSWGMNTDLEKVFTGLLLPLAKEHKIKPENMIKRLFVFSDMQFDEAQDYDREDPNTVWETTYDRISREYQNAGYEMPQIVYWDLGAYDTVEVPAEKKGVAMMKGHSASMMKVFMEDAEEIANENLAEGKEVSGIEKKIETFTPLNIMKKALMRPSFDGLVVLD